MKTQAKTAIVLTILLLSLLGFMPTVTFEDNHQGSSGSIILNAAGNATAIGKGKGNSKNASSASASLNLAGPIYSEGNDNQFKLWNLTGSLLVGSTTYSLSQGQGEQNSKGSLEIEAKASNSTNHALELQLYGSLQGNSVVFSSKQSKLSSQYFLSLSGQESVSITTSSSTSNSSTSSACSSQSQNQGQNQEQGHGDEECSSESSPSTVTVTQTVTPASNNTVTVTETSNRTITKTIGNQTITQTVTETTTSNATITVTETTTVVNTTITVTTT